MPTDTMRRMRPTVPRRDLILDNYRNFLSKSRIDEEGHSYRETFGRPHTNNWMFEHVEPLPWERAVNERHSGKGTRKLSFICRKIINETLDGLSVEALQATPWALGEVIWDDAVATRRRNYFLWTLFVTAYKDHPEADLSTFSRKQFLKPNVSLGPFICPISSPSHAWLVNLDLRSASNISRDDLLDIPNIPNLSTLRVISELTDFELLDDSVVRAWARSATHHKKFSKLWYLSFHECPAVTTKSFEYLRDIPSLKVIDMTGCSFRSYTSEIAKTAIHFGWRYESNALSEMNRQPNLNELYRHAHQGAEPGVPELDVKFSASAGISGKRRVVDTMIFQRASNSGVAPSQGSKKEMYSSDIPRSGKSVRASRMKDMGGLLSEFSAPGPAARKR